jgi:hypothetical protein
MSVRLYHHQRRRQGGTTLGVLVLVLVMVVMALELRSYFHEGGGPAARDDAMIDLAK